MDQQEAAAALAAMHGVQGRMAQRARWSLARHAGFGAVMGALVASFALPPLGQVAIVLACLVAVGSMVARDRRRDGFFVNGYRAGRTRLIAVGTGLFTAAAMLVALWLRERGWPLAPLVAGAVVLVAATLASIAWERSYRAELGGPR